ncbi:MAG: hypothetical protein ACK47B_05830 [Armatimonadota bacterium]
MTVLILLCSLLALAIAAREPDDEPLPVIDKLWNYQQPEETAETFRELLPRARRSGNRDYLVQLLTQLGRTQSLQGKFAEAHRILDEAEGLLQPDLKTARVRYLLERGRTFNSDQKPERARRLFREAWELANAAGEEAYALDAAHMLGIAETPDEALKWNLQAIGLAERSKNERARRWLGPLYNNTGWTYYERGDYPTALELLNKAQAFYQQHGSPVQIRIAKYSVGKTLRALGKVEQALTIQEAIRTESEQANDPDGYLYEELGECLLALKRHEEAKPHFARAYELLSRDAWLVKNEPKRVERLKELAGT